MIGRSGIGKKAFLKAFCNTYNIKIDYIDIAMFNSFKEFLGKYKL